MELDYNVVRLISAEPSKIATYNGRQLKESILKSEGRVLMGQTYLPSPILIPDCTSTELMFAFGTDMVLLNGYDFDHPEKLPGMQGLSFGRIEELVGNRPVGIIDFPAPGSRQGITVEIIRELVEYTHRKGALAMVFLDSNVEAADVDTIREVTLLMKQTGCDVHAIGDGGFGGGTWPENIYQMSVTLKGKAYTWKKMATPKR